MINKEKAILGFALLWKDEKYLLEIENILRKNFSKIIEQTKPFQLSFSKYYIQEMGEPLKKKYILLDKIIDKTNLKEIKIYSMELEKQYSNNQKRKINIDPFYIDTDQLVIATKKYRGNRIYIGDNLYIELELWFHNKSYQPFPWTYLDYKEYIPFFNQFRKKYLK
jgi:hypothetical protein